MSIFALILQSLLLLIIGLYLHKNRNKFTLIPVYSYLAVVTVYLHYLTDLKLLVNFFGFNFLISSTAYFPVIITIALALYLFDGIKAIKNAFYLVFFVSIFHIISLIFLGFETDYASSILFNFSTLFYYFWSILAMTIDIFLLAILWEVFAKLSFLNKFVKTFLVMLSVLFLDTIIFVTGAFAGQEIYLSIIKTDLAFRFFISFFVSLIFYFYLELNAFDEDSREKPNRIRDIFSFKSYKDFEIAVLKDDLDNQKKLQEQLKNSQEIYDLAIRGTSAGIWSWDIQNDTQKWSDQFYKLLNYDINEIVSSKDNLINLIHEEDRNKFENYINQHFSTKGPFSLELRLKLKNSNYKWFLISGQVKLDEEGNPEKMVGSIIDINDRMKAQLDLERMNKLMVDRELEMSLLKKKIAQHK